MFHAKVAAEKTEFAREEYRQQLEETQKSLRQSGGKFLADRINERAKNMETHVFINWSDLLAAIRFDTKSSQNNNPSVIEDFCQYISSYGYNVVMEENRVLKVSWLGKDVTLETRSFRQKFPEPTRDNQGELCGWGGEYD